MQKKIDFAVLKPAIALNRLDDYTETTMGEHKTKFLLSVKD